MSDGALVRLADAVGILGEYNDIAGNRRVASGATRLALLQALGHDVGSDEEAEARLAAITARRRRRVVAPLRVATPSQAGSLVAAFADRGTGDVEYELELTPDGGHAVRHDGRATLDDDATATIALGDVALGYHTLRLTRADGSGQTATQRLIVVPPSCPSPADVLGGRRVFGLTANLYTVRGARSWGVGDLTDLATLLGAAADMGAAFVGVNPLHALRNADGDISPYSPVSRLYRNPLYLDVAAVPELAYDATAQAIVARLDRSDELRGAREADRVDYATVMRLKHEALAALHRTFRAHAGSRRDAYAAWLAREGDALERFARFQALDEHFRAGGCGWWREWPPAYQNPLSSQVAAFAAEHEARVDYHRWLQFELDRQLGTAARRGREAGMPIGLYEDLAIGTSPSGSDVWASPSLFVEGVSVGAPPDPLGPEGQNWGLPPLNPHALREDGYRYWTALLRGALRHAGALRLDHVLGLFRQFWIPDGMSGAEGAYVRFPADELLGILALEATRAHAIVVGEDLGTVPPEVPPALGRWGVLSSKVLYFERDERGGFRSPRHYPRNALATVNTHDLAPLAGWWRGRELEIRRDVGLIADYAELARAQGERARDRASLIALLVGEGVLDPDVAAGGPDAVPESVVRAAVHTVLRRAPSWLVGISLDDLVGETEPVNVPGVGVDQYPCWSRRLTESVEQLATDRSVRLALGDERAWVP